MADQIIPTAREGAGRFGVPKRPLRPGKLGEKEVLTKRIDDFKGWFISHRTVMTNNLSCVKTRNTPLRGRANHVSIYDMELREKPFGDIAARIRWHRGLEGLTQKDYAEKIGQKRAALNNWESGDYRLSLDGALALRKIYGLSLDFMYEGIDDALPMTLRAAWRDKS